MFPHGEKKGRKKKKNLTDVRCLSSVGLRQLAFFLHIKKKVFIRLNKSLRKSLKVYFFSYVFV